MSQDYSPDGGPARFPLFEAFVAGKEQGLGFGVHGLMKEAPSEQGVGVKAGAPLTQTVQKCNKLYS
jgi:hypothetical protein